MPELPDVEHFADVLRRTSLHKPILSVVCCTPRLVMMTTCESLTRELRGKEFVGVTRRGKFMIARMKGTDKNADIALLKEMGPEPLLMTQPFQLRRPLS